ncbi:MAG: hypothetical protein FJW79_06105 [Actinobacteria bacterium]|nr:hypothetical protein [Actinomycetota bacterium]
MTSRDTGQLRPAAEPASPRVSPFVGAPQRSPVVIPQAVAGALAAGFLLVGRWSPTRLFGELGGAIGEVVRPRLWALLTLVLAAARVRQLASVRPLGQETRIGVTADRLLLILLGYMVISVFWTPDQALGMEKAFELMLTGVAVVSISVCVKRQGAEEFLGAFWWTLAGGASLLVVAAFLSLTGLLRLASDIVQADRFAVLGGGANSFGRLAGVLTVMVLWVVLGGGRRGIRAVPVLPFAVVALVLSGSRGALVSAAAACALLIAGNSRRPGTTLVMLGIVAVAGVTLVRSGLATDRLANTVDTRIVSSLVGERYMAGRSGLYRDALACGSSVPVFGAGLAAFEAQGFGVYPHNLELEVWCETGGVGVALLAAVVVAVVGGAWLVRGAGNQLSRAVLFMLFLAAQFSGDLFDSRGVFLLVPIALWAPSAGTSPARAGGRRATGGLRVAGPRGSQGRWQKASGWERGLGW